MNSFLQDANLVFNFVCDHMIFINLIFSITVIFFQRKEPKAVWAWLLILYAIPILGFVFYLLAGTDMHKRKMFCTKEATDRYEKSIQRQKQMITEHEIEVTHPDVVGFEDLVLYNLNCQGALMEDDNTIRVFTDGEEKFTSLISDIHNAKEFIHLQYYIIKLDEVFESIVEELLIKVQEGVEVRILYDAMGCRGIRKKYWKNLRRQGILVCEFFPAALRKLTVRINYRNHRKIAVIDGKIGYVGGFNIGKEYVGLSSKFGYWRDTHLRIEGSAVRDLEFRFILDWNYSNEENLFLSATNYMEIFPGIGKTNIQIISSGPDAVSENIKNNYMRLIAKAEKSIYIQTPYFIPDESILDSLIVAAHSGISVNIMIPCMPDHLFVYWATYSYIGELVLAGANCYTYDKGFLHAKGILVDTRAYCFGTANMDIRSFQLNFEVNAIVYSYTEAKIMEDLFLEDCKDCTKITKEMYHKRGLWIRIKEQVCRLFSPVL